MAKYWKQSSCEQPSSVHVSVIAVTLNENTNSNAEMRALEPMQCPWRWPNKTLFILTIILELCYIEVHVHTDQSELMATLSRRLFAHVW